jgi:hypothetical protein
VARITWTLNHDATPLYAIQPLGAFAADAYKILVGFLRDQLEEGVEVISIPGVIRFTLTGDVAMNMPKQTQGVSRVNIRLRLAAAQAILPSDCSASKEVAKLGQRSVCCCHLGNASFLTDCDECVAHGGIPSSPSNC